MTCFVCQRPVEDNRRRAKIGTCLSCGDLLAAHDIRVKQSQVGPAYNKGGFVFLGASQQARLDAGRKTTALVTDTITDAAPRQSVKPKRRRQIGIWFDANGDRRVWFAGDDPVRLGATHTIKF